MLEGIDRLMPICDPGRRRQASMDAFAVSGGRRIEPRAGRARHIRLSFHSLFLILMPVVGWRISATVAPLSSHSTTG
jgi:putative Mn2+ efflux pump MntP